MILADAVSQAQVRVSSSYGENQFFQSDGIYAEYRCRIYRCSGISGGCLSSVDDFYAVEK